MTATYESNTGIYLGAPAFVVEEDKEQAWAEKYVRQNDAYKWVLGRFVEADHHNDNGHFFPLDELKASAHTIDNAPLNMLHRSHHVVGAFAANELVYPVSEEAAGEKQYPFVEALAAMWRYVFPDEYRAVEIAHKQGKLFYSMECVPQQLGCMEESCGKVVAYAGRDSDTYCDHLRKPLAARKILQPHFVGGALIIPPTRPGWKDASITQLASLIEENLDEADRLYNAIEKDFSHLSPLEWESMMALVMSMAHGK